MNKVRQAAITREIIEVVSGAQALVRVKTQAMRALMKADKGLRTWL